MRAASALRLCRCEWPFGRRQRGSRMASGIYYRMLLHNDKKIIISLGSNCLILPSNTRVELDCLQVTLLKFSRLAFNESQTRFIFRFYLVSLHPISSVLTHSPRLAFDALSPCLSVTWLTLPRHHSSLLTRSIFTALFLFLSSLSPFPLSFPPPAPPFPFSSPHPLSTSV